MPPAPRDQEPLTPDRILAVAEDVLRRYGPAKATVVDVARALGVSHGSVYRHFPSKAALREAVTQRWLNRATATLDSIASEGGPARTRLERWLETLFEAKRHKAGDDPELFATYMVLTGENSNVVDQHVDDLVGQLSKILQAGHDQGEFAPPETDYSITARAVFHATDRFHNPSYAAEWARPGIDADFAAVRDLVVRGLAP
ncbi:TetR family transcriptional regulator [Streptomyces sp. HSW2009]|uniref:TetR/AcrR family transcriptional regulator n=1 Tax=Streptomyces sp. HSW2009 TaxID=3142890 RepID=UPI0032EB9675